MEIPLEDEGVEQVTENFLVGDFALVGTETTLKPPWFKPDCTNKEEDFHPTALYNANSNVRATIEEATN